MAQTRRNFLKTTAAAGAGALSGTLGFPMVSRAQARKVVVWWNRGYYKEEDEAMIKIVSGVIVVWRSSCRVTIEPATANSPA